ncbi:MAG TPA: helix-turn-helix domain-containing protein, partial [Pyrinomonadaceae bacterium]
GEDLPALAMHLLEKACKRLHRPPATFSPEALSTIATHPWPGNVRELENSIERACILADSDALTPADLGLVANAARAEVAEVGADFDLSGTLAEAAERAARAVERRKIADALRAHGGNKTRAAEDLGVSYKTLLTKIKEYEL